MEISTSETIRNVEQLNVGDRRMKIDDLVERLGVSHGAVLKIVHETLGFNKLSTRWVPKMPTDVRKEQCLLAARCGLARFRREGDNSLNIIVTTDETWVFHYEPESKRQSLEWKHVTSPMKKKFKSQRTTHKVMLTVFWNMEGPLTPDFKSQGTRVNSANYCELLDKVKEDIRNKRRGLQSKGVIFHQDNARPHTANRTLEKIDTLSWELLTHPPYGPDLAPSDFHLFGPLKNHMRGKHFTADDDVIDAVSEWKQPRDFYAKGIMTL